MLKSTGRSFSQDPAPRIQHTCRLFAEHEAWGSDAVATDVHQRASAVFAFVAEIHAALTT
jgi:hypothetical protein